MITTGKSFRFNSPINWEHSAGLVKNVSQNAESTFELFTDTGAIPSTGSGQIEWTYTANQVEPGVEHIGIWWTDFQLVDYDGVFELPKEAVEFLQSIGIEVDTDFTE